MELTTLLWGIGGLATVIAAAVTWHLTRKDPAAEELRHSRCGGCGQKMRYRASREGRTGRCPRCGRDVTLVETTIHRGPHTQLVGKRLEPTDPR